MRTLPTLGARPALAFACLTALAACSDGPLAPADECSDRIGSLAPGQLTASESSDGDLLICLSEPQAGTYVAMPFVAARPNSLQPLEVVVRAEGMASLASDPPAGAPVRSGGAPIPDAPAGPAFRLGEPAFPRLRLDDALHARMLERGRALLDEGRRPAAAKGFGPAAGTSVGRAPEVGESVELNVTGSCDEIYRRVGRTVAVSERAVVLTDVDNPLAQGWTDEELADLAMEFDDLVFPVVTGGFGPVTDLDGNGRVILFFTRAVNERSAGGRGIVGGFFWNGDLFETASCASSNEAEVLYLAVPDPQGTAGVPVDGGTLREVTMSVVGHELQHLVNSGRRLANDAPRFEETWLNEALSLVAEEMLFYAASGLQPRLNLAADEVLNGGTVQADFTRFGVSNVGRYNLFIQSPRFHSAFGRDGLETRGASWAFLRYALDRDPGADRVVLRRLVDGRASGLDNLAAALGAEPLRWMADWSASILLDDGGGTEPHTQPSWDFRSLIPALRSDDEFPIEVLSLEERGLLLHLGAGNAGYVAFRATGREPLVVRFSASGIEGRGALRGTLLRID